MSKRTKATIPTPKPTPDASANDKARAQALAKLNAAPPTQPKGAPKRGTPRATKPARGTKPEGWENDPLESDAALEAALAKKDAPATIAHDAKPAKATRNATAPKGSPTGGSGGRGGRGAKGGKDGKPPAKPKRLSALDAAAKVLAESDRPLRAIDMIEVMHAQGLWTSPGGKTPEATLYAAITREIASKGADARFAKVDRGMFTSAIKSTSRKDA